MVSVDYGKLQVFISATDKLCISVGKLCAVSAGMPAWDVNVQVEWQ